MLVFISHFLCLQIFAQKQEDYGPFKGTSPDAVTFSDDEIYMTLMRAQTPVPNQSYQGQYTPSLTGPSSSSNTEATTCVECELASRALSGLSNLNFPNFNNSTSLNTGIPLSTVTAYDNLPPDESMKRAIAEMMAYIKKNPGCGPNRYAVVSDVSKGSGKIRTAIIDVSTGKIAAQFPTGGGSGGVGNVPQSHATPPGFFRLTQSGLNTRKNWPTCGPGTGVNFNYLLMEGQGCRYGVAGESCANTNAVSREILFHTWPRIGASTWGCTGVPQSTFCDWAPKLSGACLYNYIGDSKF